MELVELQCSDELKSNFHVQGLLLLDFYKKYLECKQYPNLSNYAENMASMLGSAHVCEQLFLSIKVTKSKLRTKLSDGHLQDVLLTSFNLTRDHNILSSQKQHQIPH